MTSDASSNLGIFFLLLKSGMYGTPIPENLLPDSIDWKFILELATKQTVTGLIIDGISRLPERLRPDAPLSEKIDKFALMLIRSNIRIDQAAIKLVTFLNSHGISGVLLKGQGVARSYYPVPQLRQCGDIDFYVGKKQYRRAIEVCREHLLHDNEAGSANHKHFHFDINGVNIEIHRLASKVNTPVRSGRYQQWVEEKLEHSSDRRITHFGDTEITLPSYDFDAIFIFHHAWNHFMTGGIGLRQLCDWSLIFHTHYDDIDVARLETNIRRFGLTAGWKLFACIAVNHLGVSPDRMPLYDPAYSDRSEKVFDDILTNGNFGFYSKAYARTPYYKDGRGIGHLMGKARNIMEFYVSLFPLMPAEATFLFFHRITVGTTEYTGRAISRFKKRHSSTVTPTR